MQLPNFIILYNIYMYFYFKAATGVTCSDEVIAQYNEFKLKKTPFKFITYKIEGPHIVADVCSESDNFDDLTAAFPENDCRYAVYDCNFTTQDGREANKIVQIAWIPDTAKVKAKMVYAGSKDALSRAFVGVSVKVSATDASEISLEIIEEQCKRF